MDFAALSGALARMEATSSRKELTAILVGLFAAAPPGTVAMMTYLIQGKLRPDFEGVELGVAEAMAVRAVARSAGVPARRVEDAYREDGDLGRAAARVLGQRAQTTLDGAGGGVTVEQVYGTLLRIAGVSGARSQGKKARHIASLLNDAGPRDACYVVKLLLGTLRLGVAENTLMDALAAAFTGSASNRPSLEGAYNVCSDLGRVAEAAASGGLAAVGGFGVSVFSPVRPMLAERARDEAEAAARMGPAFAAEFKLDGERVQVHVGGGRVALFSRRLEDITAQYPDIVERAPARLRASEAIAEAEAVPVDPRTGAFLPFQELMHRRRKHGVAAAAERYPVSLNFFDALYVDGRSLLGEPYSERRRALEALVDEDDFARCVTASEARSESDVADMMEAAAAAGCEGLMLKAPGGPYRAGSRGSLWLKLKREYRNELGDSLDLVVVGAFFGRGRRTGRYGTLLLATYDPSRDAFPSVCKVGTGFTDESLDALHQLLSPLVELRRDPRVDSGMEADVWFSPEVVIEVVASEVTASPVHRAAMGAARAGGGLALRFPKFTGRVRREKAPEDASTDAELAALYAGQAKVLGGGRPA